MLTGLKMDLRWIENRLSERPDSTLNPILEKTVEATELVDATIASVQKISGELRPRLLDTLGICAAIKSEATRLQERTGMTVKVDCPEDLPGLSDQTAIATFRIFQEALTNIVRHAAATEVSVCIRREEAWLRLEISDNGKGINPSALGANSSLGLLGMQERASLLRGETTIAPGNPAGTVVTVHLPFPGNTLKPVV
jgi:signal transduction histidine kinase